MKKLIFLSLFYLAFIGGILANEKEVKIFDLLAKSQAKLEWDPLLEQGLLLKGNNLISFTLYSPWLVLNRDLKYFIQPIREKNGELIFPADTAEQIINLLKSENYVNQNYRVAAIVIDPGHGGKDSGASYLHTINGKQVRVSEKDIVLKAGLLLSEMLKKKFPDKMVVMTRTADITLALEERPAIANSINLNEREAIIYISLHVNASLSKTAKGFEVWYLTSSYRRNLLSASEIKSEYEEILPIMNSLQDEEYTRESIILAKEILSELQKTIGKETENRGLKEGQWLVVRKAKMPSILIELGFVSNSTEAAKLLDQAYLQKIAMAIYNGVSSFILKFEQGKALQE